MTNDEIKESVDNYKKQLTIINLTVAKIQAHCKHKETEIKSVSPRADQRRFVSKRRLDICLWNDQVILENLYLKLCKASS